MCSEIINAIQEKQFSNINELPSTEKKPHLSKTRRKVAGSTYSNLPTLFLHIHHNGKFHWVTSVKLDRQIYMLDSMSNGKQRPSLQIQLAFLQGSDNILTTKYVPQIQQQTNSIDCGLFITIVNTVKFCYSYYMYQGSDILVIGTCTLYLRPILYVTLESANSLPH